MVIMMRVVVKGPKGGVVSECSAVSASTTQYLTLASLPLASRSEVDKHRRRTGKIEQQQHEKEQKA